MLYPLPLSGLTSNGRAIARTAEGRRLFQVSEAEFPERLPVPEGFAAVGPIPLEREKLLPLFKDLGWKFPLRFVQLSPEESTVLREKFAGPVMPIAIELYFDDPTDPLAGVWMNEDDLPLIHRELSNA